MTNKERAFASSETPIFGGFTNADGTKTHDAPSFWPFGSIGPVAELGFRYAPDSAVYEQEPKQKKTVVKAVKAIETAIPDFSEKVFSSMALILLGQSS